MSDRPSVANTFLGVSSHPLNLSPWLSLFIGIHEGLSVGWHEECAAVVCRVSGDGVTWVDSGAAVKVEDICHGSRGNPSRGYLH